MNCSTSGSSVLHCNLEFSQIMFIESMMLREFILRYIDKEFRALEEEKGVQGPQGGKSNKIFFFYIALSWSQKTFFFLNS